MHGIEHLPAVDCGLTSSPPVALPDPGLITCPTKTEAHAPLPEPLSQNGQIKIDHVPTGYDVRIGVEQVLGEGLE